MVKKGDNFFEKNVEKLVLILAGILGLWLLITRVVLSPNNFEYNNESLAPGAIDAKILKEAEVISIRLEEPATKKEAFESRLGEYLSTVKNPMKDVDRSLYPVKPGPIVVNLSRKNRYLIPKVVKISDPVVEHIRSAAYFPAEPVTVDNTYEQMDHDINDLDLITVEANLDIEALSESFYENFAGYQVKEDWRDPCLAKPIFAAVELYRQEQIGDDRWSQWQYHRYTQRDRTGRYYYRPYSYR